MAEEKKEDALSYLETLIDRLKKDKQNNEESIIQFPLSKTPNIKEHFVSLISDTDSAWISNDGKSLKGSPSTLLTLFETLRDNKQPLEQDWQHIDKEAPLYVYPKQILSPENVEIQNLEYQETILTDKKGRDVPYTYRIQANLKKDIAEDLAETLAIEIRNHILPTEAYLDVSLKGETLDIWLQDIDDTLNCLKHIEENNLGTIEQLSQEKIDKFGTFYKNFDDFQALLRNPKTAEIQGSTDIHNKEYGKKAVISLDIPRKFGDLTPLKTAVKAKTDIDLYIQPNGTRIITTEISLQKAEEVMHFTNNALKEEGTHQTHHLFDQSVFEKLEKAKKEVEQDEKYGFAISLESDPTKSKNVSKEETLKYISIAPTRPAAPHTIQERKEEIQEILSDRFKVSIDDHNKINIKNANNSYLDNTECKTCIEALSGLENAVSKFENTVKEINSLTEPYKGKEVSVTKVVPQEDGKCVVELAHLGTDTNHGKDRLRQYAYGLRDTLNNKIELGVNKKTKAPIIKVTFRNAQEALHTLSELKEKENGPTIMDIQLEKAERAIPDPAHLPFAHAKLSQEKEGKVSITIPKSLPYGRKFVDSQLANIEDAVDTLIGFYIKEHYGQHIPISRENDGVSFTIPQALLEKKQEFLKEIKNTVKRHTELKEEELHQKKQEKYEKKLEKIATDYPALHRAAEAISPMVDPVRDAVSNTALFVKNATSTVLGGFVFGGHLVSDSGKFVWNSKPSEAIKDVIAVGRNTFKRETLATAKDDTETKPKNFSQREEEKQNSTKEPAETIRTR